MSDTNSVVEIQKEKSSIVDISLNTAIKAGRIGGQKFYSASAIHDFYEARAQEPFWVDNDGPSRKALIMYQTIQDAWTHGLNPKQYHLRHITARIDSANMQKRAELELLLSDAFTRYARDLSGKRVSGHDFKLNEDDWRQPIDAKTAISYLNTEQSFRDILKAVEPQGRTYKKLRKELVKLVDKNEYVYEAYLPIEFGGLMKPGWSHKKIANLRGRLGKLKEGRAKYVYDDNLAAAVIKFQKENGLNPDGIIGTNTLQMLNRTNDHKIKQLIVNMERLRWVDPDRGARYVMVNIPSYMLWAIDDNKVALEMPVIVGSPWRRTRMFKTEISGVRFNPDWTIPPTVKKFDIWPKVKEDPHYLLDKGIELFKGYGRDSVSLDPLSIDWKNISLRELHSIRMVQVPGAHNPLGSTRVLMRNPYNMYLHDTNKPHYFEKTERALSSGCMRMYDPEAMADFIMKDQNGWSDSKQDATYASGERTDVPIDQKIPVYILYYTNWIGKNGDVVYGSDIYGYDDKLIQLLTNLDGYSIPRHDRDHSGSGVNPHLVSYQQ